MLDFVTDAIILKKEPLGDFHATYTFFTKEQGKVTARATSVRKITSKLAAHLELGLLSKIRLVARNGVLGARSHFQIVDALLEQRIFIDYIFLELVSGVALPLHADDAFWEHLLTGNTDRKAILTLCGFGGEQACISCGLPAVTLYHPEQEFMCEGCSFRIPKELILSIV